MQIYVKIGRLSAVSQMGRQAVRSPADTDPTAERHLSKERCPQHVLWSEEQSLWARKPEAQARQSGLFRWQSSDVGRSAEETVPISAEEEQDDDPAHISAAETAYAVMFEASVVASAVAAAAAQDQDEEDQIRTAPSSCLAFTSAPTVCCRYITHVISSKRFSLHSIICRSACHSFLGSYK